MTTENDAAKFARLQTEQRAAMAKLEEMEANVSDYAKSHVGYSNSRARLQWAIKEASAEMVKMILAGFRPEGT